MVAMDEQGLLMLASPSHPTSELTVGSEEQQEWDPETHRTTIAIEVADVDAVHAEAQRLGLPVVYPLTDEPWGIRRFFVEDLDGTVINVHSHIERAAGILCSARGQTRARPAPPRGRRGDRRYLDDADNGPSGSVQADLDPDPESCRGPSSAFRRGLSGLPVRPRHRGPRRRR